MSQQAPRIPGPTLGTPVESELTSFNEGGYTRILTDEEMADLFNGGMPLFDWEKER